MDLDLNLSQVVEIFAIYIIEQQYDARWMLLINNARQGRSTSIWILPGIDGKRGFWLWDDTYFRFRKK